MIRQDSFRRQSWLPLGLHACVCVLIYSSRRRGETTKAIGGAAPFRSRFVCGPTEHAAHPWRRSPCHKLACRLLPPGLVWVLKFDDQIDEPSLLWNEALDCQHSHHKSFI